MDCIDNQFLLTINYFQMKGLPEAWSKESPPVMTNMSRPNSLFQTPTTCSEASVAAAAAAAASNMGQDLKDLYLQDLSDGMCYQSSLSTNIA